MHPSHLSRRQLLSGLAASLFAWLLPAKAAPAAPAPAVECLPAQEPSPLGTVFETVYDPEGRVVFERWYRAPPDTVRNGVGRFVWPKDNV